MRFFRKKNSIEATFEIEGNNFFFLLLSLVILLFLWPLLIKLSFGDYLFMPMLFIIFASSLYAIGKKHRFALFLVAFLAIAVLGLRILNYCYQWPFISLTTVALSIVCFFFILIVILVHILKEQKISLNNIYGAICVYLLLGLVWGLMYYASAKIDPGNIFIPLYEINPMRELSQYVYYSFVTLTSVGYGDIHPVSSFAQLLAAGEGIVGQLYSLVLIGWVVISKWRK
jgi:voltage-gated potassium channel